MQSEVFLGTSILDLTHEELVALDTVPAEDRLVVLPWFDSLDENQKGLAVVTAFRGLIARGFVETPGDDDASLALVAGTRRAVVSGPVGAEIERVFTSRRQARRLVIAQRTAGERQDFLYFYDVDGDTALTEFVEPGGLHRFGRLRTQDLATALERYLLPADAGGQDRASAVISASTAADHGAPPELLRVLADCHVQAEFVVRSSLAASEAVFVHGVSAGPNGVFLTRIQAGSGEDES